MKTAPFASYENLTRGVFLLVRSWLPSLGGTLLLAFLLGLARTVNRPILVLLIGGGLLALLLLLERAGRGIAKENQIPHSWSLGWGILWRGTLLHLLLYMGNRSFPYRDFFHQVTSQVTPSLLLAVGIVVINLVLVTLLIPISYGWACHRVLKRYAHLPPQMPLDLVLFGMLLFISGPIDFAIMIRNPDYAMSFFGTSLQGELGRVHTFLSPLIHVIGGYGWLQLKKWAWHLQLGYTIYIFANALTSLLLFGFGTVRMIFLIVLPLSGLYVIMRRKYFVY